MDPARQADSVDVLFVDLPFNSHERGRRFKELWSYKQVLSPYETHLGFRYLVVVLRANGFRSEIIFPSDEHDIWLAVTKELYLGAGRSYFEVPLDRFAHAHRNAVAAGCPGLARYIAWYADEAAACGSYFVERALAAQAVFDGLPRSESDDVEARERAASQRRA